MFAVLKGNKVKKTFTARPKAEDFALKLAAKHGTVKVRLWAVVEFSVTLGKFEPAIQKAQE
jgi:hypothetical protein